MSDSVKGFWCSSVMAYCSHYFVGSVSLCGSHFRHPFFSYASFSEPKKLCKKCLKALNKIQSKESKNA